MFRVPYRVGLRQLYLTNNINLLTCIGLFILIFFWSSNLKMHINNTINLKYENTHKQRKYMWNKLFKPESKHFSTLYLLSESIILLFCCPVKRKVPLAISFSLLSLLMLSRKQGIESLSQSRKKCLLRSAQKFTIYSKVKWNFITRVFWPNFTILKHFGPMASLKLVSQVLNSIRILHSSSFIWHFLRTLSVFSKISNIIRQNYYILWTLWEVNYAIINNVYNR